jgi:hypothetical protein
VAILKTLQASELSFIPEENSAARNFIQNRFGYMPPQLLGGD